MAWQITHWAGANLHELLDRGARCRPGRGTAGRHRRAAVPAPPVRPRGTLPAPLHVRARADPRRRGQDALGHAAAHRRTASRASTAGWSSSASSCRTTTCSSSCWDRRLRSACWLLLSRTGTGRMVRAAAYDREMLAALGADVGKLYTMMFMAGSFLAGLGGALVTPVRSIVPGMDVDIIVEAFIVVVIGGLGSFWGTFLGAIIFGQVLAFGILVLPGLLHLRGVRADGARARRASGGAARPAAEAMKADASAPPYALGRAGLPRRRLRAVARLALLHVPGDRHRHPRPVRGEPQPAARLHGPRLVRTRRLLRRRRLHLRHPDEDLRHLVRARPRGGSRRRGRLRARVRAVLRALDPHLLLDADARLRADRLGDLLQVELGDGRRAGPVQRALSQPGLDVLAAGARRRCAASDHFYLLVLLLVGVAFCAPETHRRIRRSAAC